MLRVHDSTTYDYVCITIRVSDIRRERHRYVCVVYVHVNGRM